MWHTCTQKWRTHHVAHSTSIQACIVQTLFSLHTTNTLDLCRWRASCSPGTDWVSIIMQVVEKHDLLQNNTPSQSYINISLNRLIISTLIFCWANVSTFSWSASILVASRHLIFFSLTMTNLEYLNWGRVFAMIIWTVLKS